jgi:hypothetical protein
MLASLLDGAISRNDRVATSGAGRCVLCAERFDANFRRCAEPTRELEDPSAKLPGAPRRLPLKDLVRPAISDGCRPMPGRSSIPSPAVERLLRGPDQTSRLPADHSDAGLAPEGTGLPTQQGVMLFGL